MFNLGYVAPARVNTIEFVTTSTTGNSTDFGDLTDVRNGTGALSNSTRGVWGGGENPNKTNIMDFVTIASTGNATDFGDMTVAARGLMEGSATTKTRGLLISGKHDSGYYNVINFVTFSTAGNATDFGDTTGLVSYGGAISDTNGGLAQ